MKPIDACRAAVLAVLAVVPFACRGEDPVPTFADTELQIFKISPTPPASDNKVTAAKVALGRSLYHDKRLSKDGTVACASCHDLAKAGTDNKPVSEGVGGQKGGRNAPTTLDAALQFAQFWDGRAASIEDQAIGPMLNPIEHGVADEAELTAKLKADAATVAAFARAFPGEADPVTKGNFQLAVGAFERTLITHSRFDDFLAGAHDALAADEKRGLRKFLDLGCTTCHMGRLLGGSMYQKLGLKNPFPSKDLGRAEHTKQDADKGFFKVPTLRNVADTGPWFHDGGVQTLEEAVRLMAWHQLGQPLTPEEIKVLVAFLKSLSGPVDPKYTPAE